jgi:DNA-binding LytR/AlgR family response regulator
MKKKILIVEDDNDLREKISFLLKINDYNVLVADCGKEGINCAVRDLPDCIICDIMLPDIDGYQVLDELKKNKETKLIPFIFLTAKAEMSDLRKGMNLGADDYLTKPFKISELLQIIKIRVEKSDLYTDQYREINPTGKKLDISDFLLLDSGNKVYSIKINDIVCIRAEGNYTNIFSKDGNKYTMRKLIKEWMNILPQQNFVRIHRSVIINLNDIAKIEKGPRNNLIIHLNGYKETLSVSRRLRAKLTVTTIH